jgi:hypothetical protein
LDKSRLKFSRILLNGSNDIDMAIANQCNISFQKAEEIKKNFKGSQRSSNNSLNEAAAVSEEVNMGYIINNALNNIVSDVSRFIEFYISRNNTNRLKRLYVCGGGSLLKGLADYFSASFSISVKPLPLTKEIEYKIVENKDNLIKIRAKPEAGFNYDYYLYVPNGAKESDVKYMLVEPNNSGNADDNSQFHDEQASNLIKYWICNKIANSLRIPLLVPTFDRPRSEWKMYTHALDRDTLMNKSGKLARVDLQLIKMIENAQQILNENGIKVDDKVFMDGFSASGNFVNRFAALHPEKVRAVASGGVNGMPIIPYEYMNGEKLIYHVGVADIEEITGIKFNMKEYREVAQYIYMGEWDTNDTLKFSDAYSEEEVRITEKVLGKEMKDRWLKAQEILKKAEIPAQMVTYNGTTHQVKPEMVSDIIAFFRANASSDIKFIEPAPVF